MQPEMKHTQEWYYSECDRMLYTRIPYNGPLPGKWQNGFSVHINAHKSLGDGAANQIRDRIKSCLDALSGIPDPAAAVKQAKDALARFASLPVAGYTMSAGDILVAHNALRALGG